MASKPVKPAKKGSALAALGLIVGGLVVGGGAGIATDLGYARWTAIAEASAKPEPVLPPEYVKLGPALIPLADADGRLAGYARIDIDLEVAGGRAEHLQDMVPLVRHEINMVAWQTPLAAGPDGRLIALDQLRLLVAGAANRALGPRAAKRVLIQAVAPA
jgi:flagellar basal body-associated protein FliL